MLHTPPNSVLLFKAGKWFNDIFGFNPQLKKKKASENVDESLANNLLSMYIDNICIADICFTEICKQKVHGRYTALHKNTIIRYLALPHRIAVNLKTLKITHIQL